MSKRVLNLETGLEHDVPDGHWSIGNAAYELIENRVDFSEFTVTELKEYATENDVDLGDATRKADIITVLEEAEAD